MNDIRDEVLIFIGAAGLALCVWIAALERDRLEQLRREALEAAYERWDRYRRALIEFRRLCAQPQHPLLPEACDLWLSPAEKQRQRRLIEFRPVCYEMPVRRRRSRVAAAVLAILALRH